MPIVIQLAILFVALQHLGFLVLEMFLWTKPVGLRVFGQSPEKARDSAVLAANQGLYNGFLAAGLLWSLCPAEALMAFPLRVFFLGCVVVAGLYGGYSVSRRILVVQALPAAAALLLVVLTR